MGVTRKQSVPNFPKGEHFLPTDTYTLFSCKTRFEICFFALLPTLCNYALSSIPLSRLSHILSLFLCKLETLTEIKDELQRKIIITCGMSFLFVTVIFLLTGRKIKLVLTVTFQIAVTSGVCLKIRECILSIETLLVSDQK